MKTGVKSWKPPELQSDLKAVLQPARESPTQVLLTPPEPTGMTQGPFSFSEMHMHTWPHTNDLQNVLSQSLQPLKTLQPCAVAGVFLKAKK